MNNGTIVICEAAWACEHSEDCVLHGHAHKRGSDCRPGLCDSQPTTYRDSAGRRQRIECVTPDEAKKRAKAKYLKHQHLAERKRKRGKEH